MNLLSMLNSSTNSKTVNPREIFMTLPSKVLGYGYPRDVQSEVWRKWFDVRNEKDIILKMNTGSGKTVVGLIILQSCLNEGKGPAIYVVPDNYLVNQVVDEAKKIGIRVTDNKNDYYYTNSKAILVTTIHTIVNGYSSFGMRDYGNYPIGSIIIDDVHACMEKINNQFMIKINSKSGAYKEIINLFGAALKDYNPKNYIDIIEMKETQKRMLVPYWEWQKQQEAIYRILKKYEKNSNSSIHYSLPLLERSLDTCDCIITSSEIEISPKGIDLDKISSFKEADRRIYMSATLVDDSVFISTFGTEEQRLKNNIITPEYANDIGNRLIIFPKYINSSISEFEIKQKIDTLAEKYNVVVIVPSFSRAQFWKDSDTIITTKDDISDTIEALKSGTHIGKVVIVNRYDGIDLPGDACRMLVIDGLPPLNSLKERYHQSIVPQMTTLLREQVQRIEQGMGRGVRSNDDECCIILMGDELTDVLSRRGGIEYFSSATNCQYKLSKELWDLLVSNQPEQSPTIDQIFDLAKYSLEKDKEWATICKEKMSTVKYSNSVNIDEKIVALRKSFEKSINKQWEEAASVIKQVKDKEKDLKVKGLLCQIQAEYINFIDSISSQQILKSGKNFCPGILSPIEGIEYQRTKNASSQAKAIINFLSLVNTESNDLIILLDGILSNLHFGCDYEKFEDSLNQIGRLLGFVCSRPDKDSGGKGPDNLWAIDSDTYLVIECKNESTASSIKKDYCNQLSGSVNWFKENYPHNNCIPIIVHPSNLIDSVASPVENMRLVTEKELELFRSNVRSFYLTLARNENIEDISYIKSLLKINKLRKSDIVNNYTVEYKR